MEQELLTIFHFNDIYNIQPYSVEPKAGAAYFNSLLQREKKKYQHALTLFSGDAFAPSLLSTMFDGQNMIKPLNSFGIDLACYGNHDFDYQLQHVEKLSKCTNFPWLLSNILDKRTQKRLASSLQSYVIEKNGVKIGFFSLAEQQWIDTLYPYYKEICKYIPFIEFAEKMVKKLREEEKCDLIIALTHMMKYNDIKLAKSVKGIDLILGGHDHLILHEKIGESVLIKSGTDFKNFSIIKVHKVDGSKVSLKEIGPSSEGELNKAIENASLLRMQSSYQYLQDTQITNGKWRFQVQLKTVNHSLQNIEPDGSLHDYIEEMYKQIKVKQEKIACFTKKEMDLRFKKIRKQQSPFLEFMASIYRHESGADIAMMNSGNFRMDRFVEPGPITFGVIQNIITDTITLKLVPGPTLIEALEVSVAMYPNLSGRYSDFSGIGFTWDASKKPGERILVETIKVHGEPLQMERTYKVAVHSFMGAGGDGYECLKNCETIERDGDKTNAQLLHELLHVNHCLLDSFIPKYPGRFNIIKHEDHSMIEFDLPEPKNVLMIMSTGKVYDGYAK